MDNAVIESWHSTAKFELRRLERFVTKAEARPAVAAGIDEYNRVPRHSSLGMRSPIAFGVAAVASVAAGIWFPSRTGALHPLWALATVEMAVMGYMFLPTSIRSQVLSGVLAGYLAGVGLLWAMGKWDRNYRVGHSTAAAAVGPAPGPVVAMRVSLTAMTGGMAYMLLAM